MEKLIRSECSDHRTGRDAAPVVLIDAIVFREKPVDTISGGVVEAMEVGTPRVSLTAFGAIWTHIWEAQLTETEYAALRGVIDSVKARVAQDTAATEKRMSRDY